MPLRHEARDFLSAGLIAASLIVPARMVGGRWTFLVVIVGLLAAVNDRNFAYLGAFIVGLGLFVSGPQWLLKNRRRITLVIMTGLMLGSLRALWPWQTESGEVLAPEGHLRLVLLLIALGAVVILGITATEVALMGRRGLSPEVDADPEPRDA